jgi:hypothetical protein
VVEDNKNIQTCDKCFHLNKRPSRKKNILYIDGFLIIGMVDEDMKTLLNDNRQ